MTARDWHDDRGSKPELLQGLILGFVPDCLPQFLIIDVCKQLGSPGPKNANDREYFIREIFRLYLDLLRQMFLFRVSVGDQTGSDLTAIKSQIHEAPVCECRNG